MSEVSLNLLLRLERDVKINRMAKFGGEVLQVL